MNDAEKLTRARTRYGALLYRMALLRDGDPARAGRDVVSAFTGLDWHAVELDDQLELRLLAALPPLGRLRRSRTLPGVQRSFWRLPVETRLAFGLHLLRGMSTADIARALRLHVGETRGRIVDGLALLAGDRPLPEGECRRCAEARLDEWAGQVHALSCEQCRETSSRAARAARELTEQLARTVGTLMLPPAVDIAIQTALVHGAASPAEAAWQRPSVLRGGVVLLVIAGLLLLWWPRGSAPAVGQAVSGQVVRPQAILEQARAHYSEIPTAQGVVHRHYTIDTASPLHVFDADEWVDPQQPARHRMQLLANGAVQEWQTGDGKQELHYLSNLAPWFCGAPPLGMQSYAGRRNVWTTSAQQQGALRTARWQSGVWGLGLFYIDLASEAESVRSLGTTRDGDTTIVTVTAEGSTISGTLLLQIDARTFGLREVREIRTNNGQTEVRVPWRLTISETIDDVTALQKDLLTSYPAADLPSSVQRQGPIVDQACPLSGIEHATSLGQLLAASPPATILGLPTLPPQLDSAILLDADPSLRADGFAFHNSFDLTAVEVVYLGPSRRLVLSPVDGVVEDHSWVSAGQWRVKIDNVRLPNVTTAIMWKPATPQTESSAHYYRISGTGWTTRELLTVLATVQPLGLTDWTSARDRFFDPDPMGSATLQRILPTVAAVRPRPGQILHQIKATTTHQAPWYAELADPYHMPADKWPPVRRVESWEEIAADGSVTRWRERTTSPDGRLLIERTFDGRAFHVYDGLYNSVYEPGLLPGRAIDDDVREILSNTWQWSTLPDGGQQAEHPSQIQLYSHDLANGIEMIDSWTADLPSKAATVRLRFDAAGNLRERATLVEAPTAATAGSQAAPTPSVVLDGVTIQQREWLSADAATSLEFNPPADATVIAAWQIGPGLRTGAVHLGYQPSAAAAAAAVSFPLWAWPDSAEKPGFRFSLTAVPLEQPAATIPERATIDDAVSLGLAAELTYSLDGARLALLQGPKNVLATLLRQTPARWTTSQRANSQQSVVVQQQPRTAWMMQGPDPRAESPPTTWIVIDLDLTLVVARYTGPPANVPVVLKQLNTLRVIERPTN